MRTTRSVKKNAKKALKQAAHVHKLCQSHKQGMYPLASSSLVEVRVESNVTSISKPDAPENANITNTATSTGNVLYYLSVV